MHPNYQSTSAVTGPAKLRASILSNRFAACLRADDERDDALN
jgi:hypothetical protein